eukprot:scaffold28844_cov153-Isochrysis_galbana.AAC.2
MVTRALCGYEPCREDLVGDFNSYPTKGEYEKDQCPAVYGTPGTAGFRLRALPASECSSPQNRTGGARGVGYTAVEWRGVPCWDRIPPKVERCTVGALARGATAPRATGPPAAAPRSDASAPRALASAASLVGIGRTPPLADPCGRPRRPGLGCANAWVIARPSPFSACEQCA